MSNKLSNLIAVLLLIIMAALAITSMAKTSATFDERAHIPAGYSYLAQQDYRVNPEHPPLVKDFAATPLLLLNPDFPAEHPTWKQADPSVWWTQFDLGTKFLYQSGNNPDQIIFWSRIPMIIILLILGGLLYYWTKKLKGNKVALFVLTLFTFSPSFLAHGRFVTNDVAAGLGFLLGIIFWLNWLKNPSWKNIVKAGLAAGVALLIKFSLVLLIPVVAIATLVYVWVYQKSLLKYLGLAFGAGLVALGLIWIIYQLHVLNYPIEKQLAHTKSALATNDNLLTPLCIWMANKPGLRSMGHYLMGLLMATQRTAQGNSVYFMGMISGTGWWFYFPVVYFLKLPLAFHLLTLLSIGGATYFVKKRFWEKSWFRLKSCIKKNFALFTSALFIVVYWVTSIQGNLNIGIRHVLPTFPFIYLLVGAGLKRVFSKLQKRKVKVAISLLIAILIGWYVGSSITVWPHYLTYFNSLGGGSDQGYRCVVDSNYDWGQDLKRLEKWVERNNVDKIYVDYFGGGSPQYYLSKKYKKWDPQQDPSKLPSDSYLAVSVNERQGGMGNPTPDYKRPTGYYRWLKQEQLVTKAGKTIFIYHVK